MINKQSNVYTIVYITVLVVVVGAALALTAMSLKEKQEDNARADKMGQILQAVRLTSPRDQVIGDFGKYITEQYVVNAEGSKVDGVEAFNVNVAVEAKKPAAERLLPVYVCDLPDAGTKYILPLAGMGLWGPIWGYVSFDADGTTIYGAFFDHQSETPGLGAEIAKPLFSDQFRGLSVVKNGAFIPVTVVKKGGKPDGDQDYVDGISGGTITSMGVASMLDSCLTPYKAFLESLCEK